MLTFPSCFENQLISYEKQRTLFAHLLDMHMIYYYLLFVLVVLSVTTPAANAQNTKADCHCHEADCELDLGEWKCLSWTCASGFYGAPYCNRACEPLTYGINCEKFCHCPPGDTCDSVNGLCDSNKCHEYWYGASCQVALPALHMAPDVTIVNCSTLEVTWSRWNSSYSDGAEDTVIHSYIVRYCEGSDMGECVVDGGYTELPIVDGYGKPLIQRITGLKTAVGYVIEVVTNRDEEGKQVVGRASDFTYVITCLTTTEGATTATPGATTSAPDATTSTTRSATTSSGTTSTTTTAEPTTTTTTTHATTTTTPPVPLPLDNVTLQQWNSSALTISWQLPDVQTGLVVTGILINVTRLRYKACTNGSGSRYTESSKEPVSSQSFSIYSLSPFSDYECAIALEYTLEADRTTSYSNRYVQTFSTERAAPTKKVAGFAVGPGVGSTWLVVGWSNYPCQWWNSEALTKFELEVSQPATNTSTLHERVVSYSYNLTSLLPNIKYGLRIRAVTKDFTGVWTDKVYASTLNTAPPKAQVEVSTATSDSIEIRIVQPDTTIDIEYYNITYVKRRVVNCMDDSPGTLLTLGPFSLLDGSSLTQTLRELQPYTLYDIQVINANDKGSAVTSIEQATEGVAPRGKVTIADSNILPGQVNFIWQRLDCRLLLGVLQHYQVVLFEGDKLVDDINTLQLNYTIVSPTPSIVYRIQVRVVNNYGPGDWSASYNTTSEIVRAPMAVGELRLTGSTPNSLNVSWSLPSLDGNQGAQYRVKYELIQVGDCQPSPDSQEKSVILDGQPTEYVITGLQAWATYEVTVESFNSIGTSSNHSQFSTAADKPTADIVLLPTSNTGTEVTLNWLRPTCEALRGVFRDYQYRMSGIDDNSVSTDRVSDIDIISVTLPVSPNQRYEAKLRIRNNEGWGQYSSPLQITAINIAPSAVTLSGQVGVGTITVSWSRESDDKADEVTYNISIAAVKYASCGAHNSVYDPAVQLGAAVRSHSFTQLRHFSVYKVLLVAANDVGSVETSQSFTTLPLTPVQSATDLQATGIYQTTIEFRWNSIACDELTGDFLYYVLTLTDLSGGRGAVVVNHTATSWTAAELRPFTEYRFSVALQLDGVEISPAESISVYTKESVPSAVGHPVSAVQPTPSSLTFSWRRPEVSGGEVLYWLLEYTLDGVTHSVNVSADLTSYTLLDTLPFTTYSNIVVKAVGSMGTSTPSPPISFTTRPQRPGAPRSPNVTSNMSCITLAWKEPALTNGRIEKYRVVYKQIAAPTGPVIDEWIVRSVDSPPSTFCDLQPSSNYYFIISAFTADAGEGTTVNITGWTKIGTPPAPQTPEVQSSTETTITLRLYAVESLVSPVSAYEIWVSESSTAKRRKKRDTSYQASSQLYAKLKPIDFTSGYYDFAVGDNRTTFGLYTNKPLKESQQYDMYHVVVSELNGQTTSSYSTVNASTMKAGLSDGWVVAIAFIVLAVLVLIFLIIWCIYRRKTSDSRHVVKLISNEGSHGYSPQPMPLTPTKEHSTAVYTGYWSPSFELGEDRHIVLEDMEEDMHTDRHSVTFQQEFNNLPRGQQYPWSEAAKHPELNRVSHLVAYDHNRIKVTGSSIGVDYINATHISGFGNKCSYIATTSPFSEDCALQFWQMIYEQKVSQIVMMTNMIDEGIVKCVQYWPECVGDREVFGHVTVELIEVQNFTNFTIYKMKLWHGVASRDARDVVQYHYTSWPAHGVPHTTFPLLDFRLAIRSAASSSPLVVHCGTGSSTTGFFIAVDYLIAEADANGNNINVYRAVSHLRESRSFLVRTQKQYLYIYDCLFEYLLGGEKILSQGIKSKFRLLTKANPESGQRYFNEEMKRLNKFTPSPSRDDLTAATLDTNRHKNRYRDDMNVLPTDMYRVKLSLEHGTCDYINAVYIDGYHQSNAFILTQTPLADTVVDFWRMVYEQGVSAIVMMDGVELMEDTCASYWPEPGHLDLSDSLHVHKAYGEFEVQLHSTEQIDDICIAREMVVTNKLQPAEPSRRVKHFQVLEWFLLNRTKPPKTGGHMLRLMEEVDVWRRSAATIHNQSSCSPILVHCLNGATHSAVYPTASLICEKMAAENHVNIFLTVKEVKHRRKDAVSSKYQYKYLHTVLRDYLNKDQYSVTGGGDYHHQQQPASRHPERFDSSYNTDSYESYNDEEFSDAQMKMEQPDSRNYY